jgi:hypothetical protein
LKLLPRLATDIEGVDNQRSRIRSKIAQAPSGAVWLLAAPGFALVVILGIYVFTQPERRVLWIALLAVECAVLGYVGRIRTSNGP